MIGTVLIAASVWLPRSAWFLNWQTGAGGTFTITQAHAFCSNPLVQSLTVPGSTQAQDCATADNWSVFFDVTLVAGIVLLAVAAFQIYRRYRRP